jgi:hypothetical protein
MMKHKKNTIQQYGRALRECAKSLALARIIGFIDEEGLEFVQEEFELTGDELRDVQERFRIPDRVVQSVFQEMLVRAK